MGLFLYLGFSITLEILQSTIQLALIQSDLVWNNPIANRIYFDRQIKKLTEVDVIILPELFTTAFCMEGTPEQMDGETIKWMSSKAKESSAAICGSLIILENDKRYNRFVWVSPNGQIAYYDKRHLFSLLKEESKFYCKKDLENAHSAEADTLATYEILTAQLDKYEELENNIDFLADFSIRGNPSADMAGFIVYNNKEQECFSFGKYKGRVVLDVLKENPGYFSWIQQADFPLYTKKVLTEIKLRNFNN